MLWNIYFFLRPNLSSVFATCRVVFSSASGLMEMESIPSSTRKSGNSGNSLGAWPVRLRSSACSRSHHSGLRDQGRGKDRRPKLSYHLTILRKAGLIEGAQQGNYIIYDITPAGRGFIGKELERLGILFDISQDRAYSKKKTSSPDPASQLTYSRALGGEEPCRSFS
jgi:DNA-binding transcriptional ArsR family regulator